VPADEDIVLAKVLDDLLRWVEGVHHHEISMSIDRFEIFHQLPFCDGSCILEGPVQSSGFGQYPHGLFLLAYSSSMPLKPKTSSL